MADPKEILKRRLQRVFEEGDTRGLHFFCQLGGRDDALGMTTLQISASGWTLLSWRRGEEREMFSVDLSPDDHHAFYELVHEYPFWEASPTRRKREGDETNVHIRLSDRSAGTYNGVQFWEGDMETYPVLRELTARIVRLVRAISNDSIPCLSVERRAS